MSYVLRAIASGKRVASEKRPARLTDEQICHRVLEHLMKRKSHGQTWVPIEEFYRLGAKPTRAYAMLHAMNEKLIVIDRSKVQRLVALMSPSLQKFAASS